MRVQRGVPLASLAVCMMVTPSAIAHHAIGGRIPSNAWEGFSSGLAHPILGLDHFAFVVAAGLVAALHRRGALVVFSFVAASLAGTGIHLLSWDLPKPELMISFSVLLFGVLLIARQQRLVIVVILAAASGVFHGYAYGESIVGAEMTPLWAYLLGLALIQLVVALTTRKLVQTIALPSAHHGEAPLRLAGFAIGCVGLTYLAMQ